MQTLTSLTAVQSNRKRLAAPDGHLLLNEVRNYQLSDGTWHVALSASAPDGWDGSGPYFSHFVGDGATKEDAHEAALVDFRQRVPVEPA